MLQEQIFDGLQQAKAQNAWGLDRIRMTLITCYFAALGMFSLGSILLGWIFGDWNVSLYAIFWIALIILVVYILIGLLHIIVEGTATYWQKRLQSGRILLAALSALDDAVAPPIPRNNSTQADVGFPMRRFPIDLPMSLRLQPISMNYWLIAYLACWSLIVIIQFIHFPVNDVLMSMNYSAQQLDSISTQTILVDFTLIFPGLFFLFLGSRRRVYLDDQGIWWRRLSGWAHMPWTSIHAIGFYRYYAAKTTYVLDAEEQLIMWSVGSISSARERANSLQLLHFAMARSGQPMRDLDPLVNQIARQFPIRSDRYYLPQRTELNVSLTTFVTNLLIQYPFRWSTIMQRKYIRCSLLFILGIVVLPLGAAPIIQHAAQPAYFALLPVRIHAKTPIFVDELRQPDGLWPVRKPTTDDPGNYAYTAAGYTLSGNSSRYWDYATISRTFSAVAIEVTVTMTENGSVSRGDPVGVGIIARHNPPDAFNDLFFTVHNNGDWLLGQDNCCGTAIFNTKGNSSIIHTEPGATNSLLVIARGNLYIGYVNGHYVGQYFDEINFAGASGQIGLVNGDSGMAATFTDLKVWQVNAPPALTIV